MVSNLVVDFLANLYLKTCHNKDIVYFNSTNIITTPSESEKKILSLVGIGKVVFAPILFNFHWFLVLVEKDSLLIYDSIIQNRGFYEKISLIQAFDLHPEIEKLELVQNYPQQLPESNDCGIIMISAIQKIA